MGNSLPSLCRPNTSTVLPMILVSPVSTTRCKPEWCADRNLSGTSRSKERADDLGFVVAEDPCGRLVPVDNDTFTVGSDDGVRGRFEDGLEVSFGPYSPCHPDDSIRHPHRAEPISANQIETCLALLSDSPILSRPPYATTTARRSLALTAAACIDTTQPTPTVAETTTTIRHGTVTPHLEVVAHIPDAVAVNVASRDGHRPVLAWSTEEGVMVATLDTSSRELEPSRQVNGDVEPFAHPIERPAVAVLPDGSVLVAFTAFVENGGSVFLTHLTGNSIPDPTSISGQPEPETNLVHITADGNGDVFLAWLEDSTLSVARTDGDVTSEVELVDDLTCDCCNPAPVLVDNALAVPYRNYDVIDGRVVRDVASVRSLDGGLTFEETVPVADDHWILDACPFSGPAAVQVDGTLVVAFMDARQSVHADQTSSSIWVDVSHDRGATFGADLKVSTDGINRWPVMAVDDNKTIHLIWETQGRDGGLTYARSTDTGASFSTPFILLPAAATSGSPGSPSLTHHDNQLVVTWTDREGGHVGIVELG